MQDNRGYEGLAITPDGSQVCGMLQVCPDLANEADNHASGASLNTILASQALRLYLQDEALEILPYIIPSMTKMKPSKVDAVCANSFATGSFVR